MNITLPMRGSVVSAFASRALAGTTMSTSSGSTSFITAARASTEAVVDDAGFDTTVLPIRSDGAHCQIEIICGQFQGVIAETTPMGA